MAQVQHDMTLIYEGVDITKDVDIIGCVCRDVSSGESDCLDLRVDHADRWFRWGPKKNDRIQAKRSGYDTKTMYLNTIVPEDGVYHIYATASKCVATPKKYMAFQDKTLSSVMSMCAGEIGMGAKLYGVNGGSMYEYLLREMESAPVFMQKIAAREGAVLKTLNGNYTAIGVLYAQGQPAMHKVKLDDDQLDSEYIDRRDIGWTSLQIKTPFGNGLARDPSGAGAGPVYTGICVDNDAMAYRWAKNMLLMHNRQREVLKLEMDFNPGYTAMVRVDVESRTDAAGQWLIHEVEQDMLDGRTRAKMYRCVSGIG